MDGLFDSAYRTAWWAFVVATLISWFLMPLLRKVGYKAGLSAHSDERKTHEGYIPQSGGIGIVLALAIATITFVEWDATRGLALLYQRQLIVTLVCVLAICILGVLDDAFDLNWKIKFCGQIVISVAVIVLPLFMIPTGLRSVHSPLIINMIDLPFISPFEIPIIIGVAIATLWIVAVMNMLNFIDGVDGLAGGQAAIIAATFAIIAASYGRIGVAVLAAATSGGALGFLPHNWRKGGARIFMGDSGALSLGFLLAVISIQGVLKTTAAISLAIPLALMAVPIFDITFVVLKRLRHGVSVTQPDRWHLHHRLLNAGLSPRRVAAALWAWTAAMSAVALSLRFIDYGNSKDWNISGLIGLGFTILGAFVVSVVLAYHLEILKSKAVKERNRRISEVNTEKGE